MADYPSSIAELRSMVVPPPSNSGVAVWDVGPPALEHPIVGEGVGLIPGIAISVAPSEMPVGATGTPEPMVRGDAAPSAKVPTPPTCAKAEPQPRREAAMAAITKCIFIGSTFLTLEFAALASSLALQRAYVRVRRYAVGVTPVVL
jgi:hypothetical protein